MAPSLAVAPGRPFIHLLIPISQTSVGKLLNRSIFDLSILPNHRGLGEAIPSATLARFTQSKRIGERGWRRGLPPFDSVQFHVRCTLGQLSKSQHAGDY